MVKMYKRKLLASMLSWKQNITDQIEHCDIYAKRAFAENSVPKHEWLVKNQGIGRQKWQYNNSFDEGSQNL